VPGRSGGRRDRRLVAAARSRRLAASRMCPQRLASFGGSEGGIRRKDLIRCAGGGITRAVARIFLTHTLTLGEARIFLADALTLAAAALLTATQQRKPLRKARRSSGADADATRSFSRTRTSSGLAGSASRGLPVSQPGDAYSASVVHAKAREPPTTPVSMPIKNPPRLEVIHDPRASRIARSE